jgi:hypothetical protein
MSSQICTSLRCTGLSGGSAVKSLLSGIGGGDVAKNHRSGGAPDCPVSHQRPRSALGNELVALRNSLMASRLKFTGLSGEPTAPATNGRQRNQRATHGPSQRSLGRIGLLGVHRTVSGAPRGPRAKQSVSPEKEGDRALNRDCSCPVVHQTVRCATRQKARIAFQMDLQQLLAALGL